MSSKHRPSRHTLAKDMKAKAYLENVYDNLMNVRYDRQKRLDKLEEYVKELRGTRRSQTKLLREEKRLEHAKRETEYLRLKRTGVKIDDFETVKILGRGSFGVVPLAKKKDTNRLYAIKIMHKADAIEGEEILDFSA